MELVLDRRWKGKEYTIGSLYIDGKYFCDTLEDTDRGLDSSMSLEEIRDLKQKAITAIPTGTYRVRMDIVSPKYSRRAWYYHYCNEGRVPRLENVPGYEGILIHVGNKAKDTEGCILVGKNTVKGQVLNSKKTFLSLYEKLWNAYERNEDIEITIR